MKRIKWINPLNLSIAVILLVWAQHLIRNIFFIGGTLRLYHSIPKFLASALIVGILYILVVLILLRLSREKISDLGFKKPNLLRQAANGALFGTGIFALHTFLITPLINALVPKTAMQGVDTARLFQAPCLLPFLLLLTVFKGGFSEELWRIFVLTRFEKRWGRSGLIAAVIAASAVFGVGHLYQGIGGMLSISIMGVLYAGVYLRRRMAWEAVCAHAAYDILAVSIGFILYHGK